MKTSDNPFVIEGYVDKSLFCDRVEETNELLSALENGRNVVLISPRRMGKSGLIHHAFAQLKERGADVTCIYIDIFHTRSLKQLVETLAQAIVGLLDSPVEKTFSFIASMFKSLRPTLTADEITGLPSLTLDVRAGDENASLNEIFTYLKNSGKRVYIAIDEFQQINEYPQTGTEALLRSYIQQLPNVNFIYSGSKKHMMQEMFGMPQRPFYQSSQTLSLKEISHENYYEFAAAHFAKAGIMLPRECFDIIYDTVFGHTWYVQYWLNRLYSLSLPSEVTKEDIKQVLERILRDEDDNFYTYFNALTAAQQRVMVAVAKEKIVTKVLSQKFIGQHKLPATSTVKSAIEKLVSMDYIAENRGQYSIYNRFFMLWLVRNIKW